MGRAVATPLHGTVIKTCVEGARAILLAKTEINELKRH
jgi:hypothetical protein